MMQVIHTPRAVLARKTQYHLSDVETRRNLYRYDLSEFCDFEVRMVKSTDPDAVFWPRLFGDNNKIWVVYGLSTKGRATALSEFQTEADALAAMIIVANAHEEIIKIRLLSLSALGQMAHQQGRVL